MSTIPKPSKDVGFGDVMKGFVNAAHTIGRALEATWGGLFRPSGAKVRILNRNVLDVSATEVGSDVSLVITSPPYPNAYEYWLYHKYRMYWLGMDPLSVKEQEIGARPHYFKRDPHTPEMFEDQMRTVFRLLSSTMVPGGHACFQVGSSVIRGRVLSLNPQIIRRL